MSVAEKCCHVCGREVGDAHKCKKCRKYLHVICGIESELDEENERYGQETVCKTCHTSTSSSKSHIN